MIVILKPQAEQVKIDSLLEQIRAKGVSIHYSQGETETIVGLVGDTTHVDEDWLRANEIVDDIRRVSEPYKLANRRFHPEDTHITVAGRTIGEGRFSVIAGPCSVENEEQIICVANAVKASGAAFLRGGAFKPRTSPYSFQGLEGEGLRLLKIARKETGLPIVTEIMSENQLDDFADVDIIQVGARNMQNFRLLKELGHSKKPILLKRGLSSTMEELFMSAEYILAGGNDNVILCERGIRTFEKMIRNNLDISAVPIIKAKSHLPVIIDPSHAAGIAWMVEPLAKTAVAAGADGLMIEVHNDPAHALCDGAQSLKPKQFDHLMKDIKRRVAFEGKILEGQ
ncbi:MAG: 3-deoxy-7-phosphoheptulonate synthase [Clostridia bacterium]|nr:3-deoxy-7-phosphoheptulonate synthase [Clostridia bacterium]